LTYRRVEEIQNIRVKENKTPPSAPKASDDAEAILQFSRPRLPKLPNPEDDISRYRHVQIVDVDFNIHRNVRSSPSTRTWATLGLHDLQDPERLAEMLANTYGLCGKDSFELAGMVAQEIARPSLIPHVQKERTSRVSEIARHFKQLSREFEKDRARRILKPDFIDE
jgi:hypothetical protein